MLSPDDVLRHPIGAAVADKISTERAVVIWGPSGGGKSMFVNAYMDKHVSVRGSTRKLLDSSTTPSELIEDDQSVREGSYGFVMVDGIAWTKASIRFFFQKVPARTKIVLILPMPAKNAQEYSAFPNVFVPASIDPTETYRFFCVVSPASVPYFKANDPRSFYEDFLLMRGILARLLSRYMYGCSFMDTDVQASSVWGLKTLEDSVQFASLVSSPIPFGELSCGDIRLLAESLETRSLTDVQYVDIYGDDNARAQMKHLLLGAEVFRQLRHGFL